MHWYVQVVTQHPLITAMIQFAIFGTIGDIIGKWLLQKKICLPFPPLTILFKFIEWSILGIFIKYVFVGFSGFMPALISHHMLFNCGKIINAITFSIILNLLSGPTVIISHRILDNFIHKEKNWTNIDKGLLSLIWFWIPAHSITFMLPKAYQIGLAALWSIVLGIILGLYSSKPNSTLNSSLSVKNNKSIS